MALIEKLEDQLHKAKEENDRKLECSVYSRMAAYFLGQKTFDEAVFCHEKRLDIYREYEGA